MQGPMKCKEVGDDLGKIFRKDEKRGRWEIGGSETNVNKNRD